MERIESLNNLAQQAWQLEFNIGLILLIAGWAVMLYQMVMKNRDDNIVLGFMFPSITITSGLAVVMASYMIPRDLQRVIAEVLNEYQLTSKVYGLVLGALGITAIYVVAVRIYRVYGGRKRGSSRTSTGST